MLRKDRETGAFEYAEARKAYYTEQMICEILMALEQNAVNHGYGVRRLPEGYGR